MKDEDKTKEQLINELLALRQRVTELEALETERQVAEEALARERNLLRTLIDNLPDYIYAMDTEGRFVLANTTIAHYLGAASPDELLGKTNFDFYPPALAARNHALDQEIMQSGQPVVNLEESFIDLAGNPVWFLTNAIPLRDSQGKIRGLVGITRDITERKRAEEEREKLITELQDTLAHVKTLSGLLPICASCKRIRDDEGYWHQVEVYIRDHADVEFSHGICPNCLKKLYPDYV